MDAKISFLYPSEDGGHSYVSATVGAGLAERLSQLIDAEDSGEIRITHVIVDGEPQGWGNFRPDQISRYKIGDRRAA